MDLSRSVIAYRVFRNIYIDNGSYSVQLELKHGLNEDHAEQIILEASQKGFLDLVKNSDPKEYTVDFDKLAEEWYELWEEETGETPVTPTSFEDFLKGYIKPYLKNEKHSTIKEMLVDEFYIAINSESTKTFLTNDFLELKERLNQQYEGKRTPSEHFRNGLDHR